MQIRIVSMQGNHEHVAAALTAETIRGQIQVLEGHSDLIATLTPGYLVIEGQAQYYAGSGLLRVEDGNCSLMLDRLQSDTPEGREKAEDRLRDLAERGDTGVDDSDDAEIAFLQSFLAQ